MSDVKILWTQQGQIISEVEQSASDQWTLRNPAFVVPGSQGVSLIPVLALAEENETSIRVSEILFGGELFTPATELRNYYSSQFGSGIQLLTK